MELKIYQLIKSKYGFYSSWAIWDENNEIDTTIIEKNIDKLHSSIVFVGLNISKNISGSWLNFRSGKHDRKIKKAFNTSSYQGAYMTDIIKNNAEADSSKIKENLQSGEIDLQNHVKYFIQEMADINADSNTLYILFGNEVENIFKSKISIHANFKHFIKCRHYSDYRLKDDDWVKQTRELLRKYTELNKNTKPFKAY